MTPRYRGLRSFVFMLLMVGAAPAFAVEPLLLAQIDPTLPGSGPGTPVGPVPTPAPATMYSVATWPMELTLRPVVLGTGMWEIRGDLFISLTKDLVGEPVTVTPAVYYGLNEQLTLGIFQDTFCFSGDDSCNGVFDSLGLDALFALLVQSNLNLAVRGSMVANSFDAGTWDLRVGLTGKYFAGRLSILFDPKLIIGLNKRDANPDFLSIPLDFQYQIDQQLAGVLTAGIVGPLDGFGDFFQVPVGLGALYAVNTQLDVGGQFLFLNLLGKTPEYGQLDGRALQIFVNYRM